MPRQPVRERLAVLLNAVLEGIELEPLDLHSHRDQHTLANNLPRWSATYGSERDLVRISSMNTMLECVRYGVTAKKISERVIEVVANITD